MPVFLVFTDNSCVSTKKVIRNMQSFAGRFRITRGTINRTKFRLRSLFVLVALECDIVYYIMYVVRYSNHYIPHFTRTKP